MSHKPKKSLGQNFLIDKSVLKAITESADLKKDDEVLEVGPGKGVLTEKLVEDSSRVVAVEKDEDLASLIRTRSQLEDWESIEVYEDDILTFDINGYFKSNFKVVANIPYYITSKFLRQLFELKEKPEIIVLLVQKEVAKRITAKPGEMSLLSVSAQAYSDPKIVRVVKPRSFKPSPKVDSAVIKFENIAWKFSNISEEEFFRVARMGFSARRKTLLNNLSAGFSDSKKDDLSDIIKSCDIDKMARAQSLSLKDWHKLALKLKQKNILK